MGIRVLFLLLIMVAPQLVISGPDTPDDPFMALLNEAGLELGKLGNFEPLEPKKNALLDYEHAVISQDQQLEIRFAIRPLQRVEIEYEDPHGSVPDPNHIFPLMFESLAIKLSGGSHTPSREYSMKMAQEVFNADWAAAAVFDVSSEFDTQYSQGLLLAIHKSKISDAYSVFLFDDYETVKPLINAHLSALKYRSAE